MKKNRTMRAAVLLLVLTLITSCFVGGTFAKYTTAGTGSDSARVAKWGVTINGTGMSAFADTYDATVKSDVKVVAPGTDGSFSNFDISGTPEVSVQVTYDAVVEITGNWLDETGNFYCPLKVYVNNTPLCGLSYESADAFETAIRDNIKAITTTYDPGKDLSDVEDDLAVSWKWSFVHDGTDYNGDAERGVQTDLSDTELGNWAADEDTTNDPSISISVTCTITQID